VKKHRSLPGNQSSRKRYLCREKFLARRQRFANFRLMNVGCPPQGLRVKPIECEQYIDDSGSAPQWLTQCRHDLVREQFDRFFVIRAEFGEGDMS
jgi:hypothetical protein